MDTTPLQEIRLILAGIMLVYSAYKDLKEREISDLLWFIFIPIGIALLIYESFIKFEVPYYSLIAIGVSIALAFGLYKMNLYGGADALALITLSLIIPLYEPLIYIHKVTALIVFTNGVFFTLASPIYFGLKNFLNIIKGQKIFFGFEQERLWKKIVACLLGYRTAKSSKFLFSLEKIEGGKKKFNFKMISPEEDYVTVEDSWVTPGLPLLLFITVGYFFMLIVGDVLGIIFKALLAI